MNYEEWISTLETPQTLLQGLQFVPACVSVEIDIAKFDEAWRLDKVYYIPLKSLINSQRKLRFVKFLQEGKPIIIPEVRLLQDNIPDFENGRHRFSVLRDLGLKQIPMSVPESQVDMFFKLFN